MGKQLKKFVKPEKLVDPKETQPEQFKKPTKKVSKNPVFFSEKPEPPKEFKDDPIMNFLLADRKLYDSIQASNPKNIPEVSYHPQYSEVLRLAGPMNIEEGYNDYTPTLAATQPFGEQLGIAAKNIGINFLASFLDGANYDIPEMVDLVKGKEREYGNWLSNLTKKMREDGQKELIYENSDSIFDPSHFLNMTGSIAGAAGFISYMLAEQTALTKLSASTFGAAVPLQISRGLRALKMAKGALKGSKAKGVGSIMQQAFSPTSVTKALASNVGYGALKSIHEGYINGLETYHATEAAYLELDNSEKGKENAKKYASEAASLGFRLELGPLMALNILQLGMLRSTVPFSKMAGVQLKQGYSGAVEKLGDVLYGKIPNKFIRKTLTYGTVPASEMVEEMDQTGVSKYAKHTVMRKTNDVFSEFELIDQEFIESGQVGAISGGLFHMMGNAARGIQNRHLKKLNNKYEEAYDKAYKNYYEQAINNATTEEEIAEIETERKQKEREDKIRDYNEEQIKEKEKREQEEEEEIIKDLSEKEKKDFFKGKKLKKDKQRIKKALMYDLFLNQTKKQVKKDLLNLKRAQKEGNEYDIKTFIYKLEKANILNSFILDNMKGNEVSIEVYLQTIEELAHAIKNKDIKTLKKFDIKNFKDIDYVVDKFDSIVTMAIEMKKSFDKHFAITNNFEAALQLTDAESVLNYSTETSKKNKEQSDYFLNEDKIYKNLSSEQKEIMNASIQIHALRLKEQVLPLTEEEQIHLDELLSKHTKLFDKLSKRDQSILHALEVEPSVDLHYNNALLDDMKNKAIEKIKYWKNSSNHKNPKDPKITRTKEKETPPYQKPNKKNTQDDDSKIPEAEIIEAKRIEDRILEKINNDSNNPNNNIDNEEPISDIPIEDLETLEDPDPETLENDENSPSEETSADELGNILDDNGEIDDLFNDINKELENVNKETEVTTEEPEIDDISFDPLDVEDIDEPTRKKIDAVVVKSHDSLQNSLNKEPTFEEFMKAIISQQNKEVADKLYNAFQESWRNHKYLNANYINIYNDLIKSSNDDLDEQSNSLKNVVNNQSETRQDLLKSTVETRDKIIEDQSSVTETSIVQYKDDKSSYKTSSPELRASFLSKSYKREFKQNEDGSVTIIEIDTSTELNNSQHIDSKKLLDSTVANPEVVFNIKIPENHDQIHVVIWDKNGKKQGSLPYGQWKINKTPEEQVNKIPMIAYDNEGTPLFFVHDVDWYNEVNVGLKQNKEEQKKVIDEAQENYTNLRKSVFKKGNTTIEITRKRLGTFDIVEKNKPLLTLNEANPDIKLGVVNGYNELIVNGQNFENGNNKIVNRKSLKVGNVYNIRKSTVENEYIAFETMRYTLNESSVNTLKSVIQIYLFQYEKNNIVNEFDEKLLNYKKREKLRREIYSVLKLDVTKFADFEKFLNLYLRTFSISPSQKKETKQEVNKRIVRFITESDGASGLPFMVIQKGAIVFGKKQENILVTSNNDYDVLSIHPRGTENGKKQIKLIVGWYSILEKLLWSFTQNTSIDGLELNRKMINIDNTGTLLQSKNTYEQFLKNVFKTNVRSFNIGTQKNPNYATVIQPVINYKEVDTEWKSFVNTGKVSHSKIVEIAEKLITTNELTAEEEQIRQEVYPLVENEMKNFFSDSKEASKEASDKTEYNKRLINEALDALEKYADNQGKESNIDTIDDVEIIHEDIIETVNDNNVETINEENIEIEEEVSGIEEEVSGIEGEFSGIKEEISGIEGLSFSAESQIVDYIYYKILLKVGFNNNSVIDTKQILKDVKQSYFDVINNLKANDEKLLGELEDVYNKNAIDNFSEKQLSKIESLIEDLGNKIKVIDIIKNNWSILKNKALQKIRKNNIVKEVKKSYSSGIRKDTRERASAEQKLLLSSIKDITSNNKVRTGFLGAPIFLSSEYVWSTLENIFITPYELEAKYDLLIARLKENQESYKWLKQVIDRLEYGSEQAKAQFVYTFTKHSARVKFIMFDKNNNNNTHSLTVYDANSNEITRLIIDQWKASFKNSPLVYSQKGEHKINKEKAEELFKIFQSWEHRLIDIERRQTGLTSNISNSEINEWLSNFGINLSDQTLNELRAGKEFIHPVSGKRVLIPFANHFIRPTNVNANTPNIFGYFANYLKRIISEEDTSFDENISNHPFTNASGILAYLVSVQKKYINQPAINSFMDGNKPRYGFTPSKYATETITKLKYNQAFRDSLKAKSFNKHSYLLDMLDNTDHPIHQEFRNKFFIDHLAVSTLIERNKRVNSDKSIEQLPDSDQELVRVGMFQDIKQGQLKHYIDKDKSLPTRMARMFFPVPKSSQVLLLYTAVIEFKELNFDTNENDNLIIGEETKEFMYSQLVRPELERILNFKKTNIDGYDLGAQQFLFLPELNNLVDPSTNERAIALMALRPDIYNLEWFENTFKEEIKNIISDYVFEIVKQKIEQWKTYGFIENGKIKFFDNAYMMSRTIELAANDYVINAIITNANIHMLFAGDIALYVKSDIKSYFKNGKPYLPKDQYGNNVYSLINETKIGLNMSKRISILMNAGGKIAETTENEEYIQLSLKDPIDMASNIKYIIGLRYKGEEKQYAEKKVDEYRNTESQQVRKEIVEELSNKYPDIASFFEIELSDSQEYSTLKEHVYLLRGKGELTDKQYDQLIKKIELRAEAEANNKPIPNLTNKELKIIFRPFKTSHVGFKDETTLDVMRMVQVKSSTFPLISEMTVNSELDGLRKLMEKLERQSNKPVRASYKSANKVGGNTNTIEVFLPNGRFNANISSEEITKASLTLQRHNLRIQQEMPSTKNKTTVSLGTQTTRLLLGDGILDSTGFSFEGKELSGRELQAKFVKTYNEYITHKRKMFFKELSVDDNGNVFNAKQAINKAQKFIEKQISQITDMRMAAEVLKLVPVYDEKGENIIDMQFNLPLWMGPNSDRYETLLNAIVANQLINIKLPGNSYNLASEAGFKIQNNLDGINVSQIVFTKNFSGELKGAEVVDNVLQKGQVIVSSVFRDNKGNRIYLIYPNGKPNLKYVEKDEKGIYRLKEEMIDKELLSIPGFRIPTSGHLSMNQLEIVGFFPPLIENIIVMPRNLIAQVGHDNDGDTQYTYQLHTYVDKDGKIKVFDETAKTRLLEEADKNNKNKKLKNQSFKGKLLRGEYSQDTEFKEDEINETDFLSLLNDKFNQKLLENEIVKYHSAVLSNATDKVQKKINQALSVKFASNQAEMIQEELRKNVNNKYFTVLSDVYQKNKMQQAASGEKSIAIYSNAVVFHSMVQQSMGTDFNDFIQILKRNKDNEKVPIHIQIGNQISKGVLGTLMSLAPESSGVKRSNTEAFTEKLGTATDDEKEGILGRVNINESTINADIILTALGFDKATLDDGTPISISYFILSQPIILEYVKKVKQIQASTSEYNKTAISDVIEELRQKYEVAEEYDKEQIPKQITGQVLFDNLNNPSNAIQLRILDIFLHVNNIAKTFGVLQNRLNINSTQLGKSFFDVIDKYDAIQNVIEEYENKQDGVLVKNASKLIGDYVHVNTVETETKKQELVKNGYLLIGNYYIKPGNPFGSMLINSVYSAYNLWKDHFPYNDPYVESAINDILPMMSNENTSAKKTVELKETIFKEMKKFFVSSNELGLYNNENIRQERIRLFIDIENVNESLASYLNRVLQLEDSSIDYLRFNNLISSFQYQINKDGLQSLIKYINSKSESFDEDLLYNSLITLMNDDVSLPSYNDKPYSTKKLGKDLIAYSYLRGGIQEAIEFVKYIPIQYLNKISFGKIMRGWNSKNNPVIFKNLLGVSEKEGETSIFTKQFAQHMPNKLPSVEEKQISDPEYIGDKRLSNLISFEINEDKITDASQFNRLNNSKFIAIYNSFTKKGLSKFQVYEKSGTRYKRISTLKAFGISQYTMKENDVIPIVGRHFKNNTVVEALTPVEQENKQEDINDTFNIKEGNVSEIVNNIANYSFLQYRQLAGIAKLMLSFIDNNIKVEIADILSDKKTRIANAQYSASKNTITIDKYFFENNSDENIAKKFMHELYHALTVNYINQFIDDQGRYLTNNTPKEIQQLVILFNNTKNKLKDELDVYKEKRNSFFKGEAYEPITVRERKVIHGLINIKEFITFIMEEPLFQQEMIDTKYKLTDNSSFDKYTNISNNILQKIVGKNYNENGITLDAVKATLIIIKKHFQDRNLSQKEKNQQHDLLIEDALSTETGNVVSPHDDLPPGFIFSEKENKKENEILVDDVFPEFTVKKQSDVTPSTPSTSNTPSTPSVPSTPTFTPSVPSIPSVPNTPSTPVKQTTQNISVAHPIFSSRREMIEYTDDQKIALNMVSKFLDTDNNFFLLAGYAGTGKTTIAENIFSYSNAIVIAPTNAAIERLREKFGHESNNKSFFTVHQLVYGMPDEETGKFIKPKLPHDKVIILDEASMLDASILNDIVSLAMMQNTKIIFLGDSFQLEPIGNNPKLFTNFDFDKWKTELKEVKRQDNAILDVATHLRSVKKPEIINIDKEEFKTVLGKEFIEGIQQDVKNDEKFVVLTTTNKSRVEMNNFIRKEKFGENASNVINDKEKLIAIANVINKNSQVFEVNKPKVSEEFMFKHLGKEYKAVHVNYTNEKDQKRQVLLIPSYDKPSLHVQELLKNDTFTSNKNLVIEKLINDEMKKIWIGGDVAVYGYATTIHKSQGNEWNSVHLMLPWMHNDWNHAKMIYTGITRGKQKVRLQNSSNITLINKNTVLEDSVPAINEFKCKE